MTLYLKNEFEKFIDFKYKSAITSTLNIAEKLNIKIFLIGGIVRDLILKIPIKDIDITVQGDAILFCKNLEKNIDCKIISVQENLRTAKVLFPSGIFIDFASTREEIYSSSGVLPAAQNFGCPLAFDVKRRDFTINTLALELTGSNKFSLIDYFNGYRDIQNKIIRILHDKSFIDDPSRIIRAIKFQMRLGFNIEHHTLDLMSNYLKNVDKTIPLERIKNELKQYFSIHNDNLYKNMIDKKVYKLICDNPFTGFENSDIFSINDYFDSKNISFIYFALLLINSDFENPRLNLTHEEKKIINETKNLISIGKIDINNNFQIYKSFINKPDLSLILYHIITKDKSVIKFLKSLKNIKIQINGNDLIQMGFSPSPYFSELFEKVLKEKLERKLQTKEDEINFIKKIKYSP